jgi:hypothetical protein
LVDYNRRTSQYERKYHQSPSNYDPKTGQFKGGKIVQIRYGKHQMMDDEDNVEFERVDGEGESAFSQHSSGDYESSSVKKNTMGGLNKRYATSAKKDRLRPKDYPSSLREKKISDKTPHKKLGDNKDNDQEGDKHDSERKVSKSKLVSYKDPKYSSERIRQSIQKGKRPSQFDTKEELKDQQHSSGSYGHNKSGEISDDAMERLSDERDQETPNSSKYKMQPDKFTSSFGQAKSGGKKSSNMHLMSKGKKAENKSMKTMRKSKDKDALSPLDDRDESLKSPGGLKTPQDLRTPDRSSYSGTLREPANARKYGSTHVMQPYDDRHSEHFDMNQDEYVQNPNAHSDYYQSLKDIDAHGQYERVGEHQSRKPRKYDHMKGRPGGSQKAPNEEEKERPQELTERRKSKYRETKDQMKDRKKKESDREEHIKSVAVDISSKKRKSEDSKSIQERFGKSPNKAERERQHLSPSGHTVERLGSSYKPVLAKEYHKGYRSQEEHDDNEDKKSISDHDTGDRISSRIRVKERKARRDEDIEIEDEISKKGRITEELKQSKKSKDDKFHIPKGYQSSTKKYDLKKRINDAKSEKEMVEGERKYDPDRINQEFDEKQDIGDIKGSSVKSTSKKYDLTKGLVEHKFDKSGHAQKSKDIRKSNIYSESEEEAYSERAGERTFEEGSKNIAVKSSILK